MSRIFSFFYFVIILLWREGGGDGGKMGREKGLRKKGMRSWGEILGGGWGIEGEGKKGISKGSM